MNDDELVWLKVFVLIPMVTVNDTPHHSSLCTSRLHLAFK